MMDFDSFVFEPLQFRELVRTQHPLTVEAEFSSLLTCATREYNSGKTREYDPGKDELFNRCPRSCRPATVSVFIHSCPPLRQRRPSGTLGTFCWRSTLRVLEGAQQWPHSEATPHHAQGKAVPGPTPETTSHAWGGGPKGGGRCQAGGGGYGSRSCSY